MQQHNLTNYKMPKTIIKRIAQSVSLNVNKVITSDISIMLLVYTLAHGLLLLNNGLFWDDWIFYKMDQSSLNNFFSSWGNPYMAYYIKFIFGISDDMSVSRSIIFLSYLIAAIFLYYFMKDIEEIESGERLVLTLIFAVFPVNIARITITCSFYAIGYALFFLGIWLVSRYMLYRKAFLRFLALAIFFISFSFANSLLVFYFSIFIYIWYVELKKDFSLERLFWLITNYPDFVALPFIFWIIRQKYFHPNGQWEHYAELTLNKLILTPAGLISSFSSSFLDPISRSFFQNSMIYYIVVFVIFVILVLLLKHKKFIINDEKNIKLFLIGILLFILALIPYYATGNIPKMDGWSSRHQILVPLGASLMLYYGFTLICDRYRLPVIMRTVAFSLIIALFVSSNIANYLPYQQDWYEQLSLMSYFKESNVISNHTTFLLNDRTSRPGDEPKRYYELTGLMKRAFGEETRLVCDLDESQDPINDIDSLKKRCIYNLKDYTWKEPEYLIIQDLSATEMGGTMNLASLMINERLNPKKFSEQFGKLTKLDLVRLQWPYKWT